MQAWQEVAQLVSMAPGASRRCRRGKRWRSRCRWRQARHEDAGVARGGTAGAGDARRVRMMQAKQVEDLNKASGLVQVFDLPVVSSFPRHWVFDLPVVSSSPRHIDLRPACRVLIPAPHRSSTCLSCPHSRAMQAFGGLALCTPNSPATSTIRSSLMRGRSLAGLLWRYCVFGVGCKIITAGAVTACCGN